MLNQSHQRATKSGARAKTWMLSLKSKAVTTMSWAAKSDLDSCNIRCFGLLLIFGGGVEQSILIIISNFSEVFENRVHDRFTITV